MQNGAPRTLAPPSDAEDGNAGGASGPDGAGTDAAGAAGPSQLQARIERHLAAEVACDGGRALIEDAGLDPGVTAQRLREAFLGKWVRAAHGEWAEWLDAKAETQRLVRLERRSRWRQPLVRWGLGLLGPALAGVATLASGPLAAVVLLAVALVLAALTETQSVDVEALRSERAAATVREASKEAELDKAILERCIRPDLREHLNDHERSPLQRLLQFEATGLAELRDPGYEIPTAAGERLDRVIAGMPGGSIGIAGPRGAGKTTLIRRLCELAPSPGAAARAPVAVVLPAPVHYDARDFILTLFAKLCHAVGGPAPAASTGTRLDEVPGFSASHRLYRVLPPIGLALVAVALAIEVVDTVGVAIRTPQAVAAVLAILGYFLLAFGLSRGLRRVVGRFLDDTEPEDDDPDLAIRARDLLRDIRFQQSYTSGYGGELKVAFGAEATVGATGSYELAQRSMSLPELVDEFREFVTEVKNERGTVYLGIDELDKLDDPASARMFLNEIKAIFGLEGCFFLVSISDEALASFEARGVPLRDEYDSAFDDVVVVRPLALSESELLLNRRTVGLTRPFASLCHALSGGIARELIRTARQLAALAADAPAPLPLAEAARGVAYIELERRARTATARLAGCGASRVDAGMAWARALARQPFEPSAVRAACSDVPYHDHSEAANDILQQLVAHACFLATIVEFMEAQDAIDPQQFTWDADALRTAERFAAVRQDLVLDVHLAMDGIRGLRDSLAFS